jgi:hypothetical protein
MLLFPAIIFFVTPIGFGTEREEYARFLETATQKWNDHIQNISRMECSILSTKKRNDEPEMKSEQTVVIDFPNYAVESKENGLIQYVNCYGKKYHFRLKRNKESGDFEITDLVPNETDVDPNLWNDMFYRKFYNTVHCEEEWARVGGESIRLLLGRALILWGPTALPQLTHFENFSIENFTEDDERIYIDYQFEPGDLSVTMEGYRSPIRSGSFVLFKDTYLLESADFVLDFGDERPPEWLQCEYTRIDGKPVLKNERTKSPNMFYTYEYEKVRFKKQPSSRFTLSHYGLSEPDFVDRRTGILRSVLVLLACMLIFYALLNIYRKRREKLTDGG